MTWTKRIEDHARGMRAPSNPEILAHVEPPPHRPRKRETPPDPWWERRIEYLTHAGRRDDGEMRELLDLRARARVLARTKR